MLKILLKMLHTLDERLSEGVYQHGRTWAGCGESNGRPALPKAQRGSSKRHSLHRAA
jgi:hypothetical protein